MVAVDPPEGANAAGACAGSDFDHGKRRMKGGIKLIIGPKAGKRKGGNRTSQEVAEPLS